jgi:hypothetical protein
MLAGLPVADDAVDGLADLSWRQRAPWWVIPQLKRPDVCSARRLIDVLVHERDDCCDLSLVAVTERNHAGPSAALLPCPRRAREVEPREVVTAFAAHGACNGCGTGGPHRRHLVCVLRLEELVRPSLLQIIERETAHSPPCR